jgi:Ca2+-binding EF-hand superfamily protein
MANPKPRIEKILKDKKQQISDQETNNQLVPYNNENKKSKQHSVALKLKEISLADLAKLDPVTRRMKTVEILHAILGTEVIKPRDIKILHKKFQEADSKKSGKLTLFQFEKIFDTYRSIENRRLKSIYVSLLFAFCDSDNSNQIDAKEFIIGLCWLSDFGNIEKLRFAFVLFDANGNGRMDREELVQLIASINMGRDSDRSSIVVRVDELFRAVAPVDDWRKYELSFEQLVAIADANSDLFQAL